MKTVGSGASALFRSRELENERQNHQITDVVEDIDKLHQYGLWMRDKPLFGWCDLESGRKVKFLHCCVCRLERSRKRAAGVSLRKRSLPPRAPRGKGRGLASGNGAENSKNCHSDNQKVRGATSDQYEEKRLLVC